LWLCRLITYDGPNEHRPRFHAGSILSMAPLVFGRLNGRRNWAQWVLLVVFSLILVATAESLHLPAALLLGPMLAAIVVGAAEASIRVPAYPFIAAQGIIGCLIGHSIPLTVVKEVIQDWPIFLAGACSVIAASSLLGWLLARWRILPGTTAIWGTSPGASTPMILMSEAYGGDIRLVAVMQYLRIVCVIMVAALVAKLWAPQAGQAVAPVVWFPSTSWLACVLTVTLAGGGAIAAARLRIPAGPLLLPLAVSMLLQESRWLQIELPPWVLAVSYAVVGWSIGLRFTRPILMHALRALPAILAATFALIAICGGFAGVLVIAAGVDPLTAYLATSPGGVDSIAIIAATSNADLRFIMAMQTARLILVLLTSPHIARFIAKKANTSTQGPLP
jgi:membrane AbrB-like protein